MDALNGRPPGWTDDEDRLRQMWAEGKSFDTMADELNQPKTTVRHRAKRLGLERPYPLQPSPWTPERDAELQQRLDAGEPYSMIAEAFSTTRSAVGGRIHRLKLPRPQTKEHAPRKRQSGRPTRAPCGASIFPAPHFGMASVSRPERMAIQRKAQAGKAKTYTTPKPAYFLSVPLLERQFWQCCFPYGGDDGDPITFCGQPKVTESYCAACVKVMYQPATEQVA